MCNVRITGVATSQWLVDEMPSTKLFSIPLNVQGMYTEMGNVQRRKKKGHSKSTSSDKCNKFMN